MSCLFPYFLKQSRQIKSFSGGTETSKFNSFPQDAQIVLYVLFCGRLPDLLRGGRRLLLAISVTS
jgi:hypothetical protein